jgi:hypothetical protein
MAYVLRHMQSIRSRRALDDGSPRSHAATARARDPVKIVAMHEPPPTDRRRLHAATCDQAHERSWRDAEVGGGLLERQPRRRTTDSSLLEFGRDAIGDELLYRVDELPRQHREKANTPGHRGSIFFNSRDRPWHVSRDGTYSP